MADISTIWSPSAGVGDWYLTLPNMGLITDETGDSILDNLGVAIADGLFSGAADLVIGNDLGTAILISLMTDRAAGDDDVIPDASGDPRGWWGDLGADRPIGSKIWLRMRSKQTELVLALVKADIEEALAWLVDDGVATGVAVTTEWSRPGFLGAAIVITRDTRSTALKFDWAWKELR